LGRLQPGPELYEGFIRAAIEHAILPNAAWYAGTPRAAKRCSKPNGKRQGPSFISSKYGLKIMELWCECTILWKHEPCFYGWIKGNRPPKVSDEWLSTVWELKSLSGDERPEQTQLPKPIECFGIPMQQHVAPGGLCYEPFCGSGTQIVAAEATGTPLLRDRDRGEVRRRGRTPWVRTNRQQAVREGDGLVFPLEYDGGVAEAPPPWAPTTTLRCTVSSRRQTRARWRRACRDPATTNGGAGNGRASAS